METNETPEFTKTDFAKFVGKSMAISALETAGGFAVLLVAGFVHVKIMEYREARKARKALLHN